MSTEIGEGDAEFCPVRSDKVHHEDWYDGERCHDCGAPAAPDCEECGEKACGHAPDCPYGAMEVE